MQHYNVVINTHEKIKVDKCNIILSDESIWLM